MEQLAAVARTLRRDHGFAGYIHLKAIPDAAPELLDEAGRWADRLLRFYLRGNPYVSGRPR